MNKLNQENGLVLINYKEPLTSVRGGYGYYGALLLTEDKNYVQCHICGGLYTHVGVHLRHAHQMKASDYKKRFGLGGKTALIGEGVRKKMKEICYKRYHALSEEQKQEMRKKAIPKTIEKNKTRRGVPISLEARNRVGTCPDQTLQKIRDCVKAIGETPSRTDFRVWCNTQRYLHLAKYHFGSWSKALKRIGRNPSKNRVGNRIHKDSEDLLSALKDFYDTTGEIPTASNSHRLSIPSGEIYSRRFGGWQKARQLAGIPEKK